MATGTGLDLQFGISSTDEGSFGTPATVDRFYPIEVGESLGQTNAYAADEGVYAGEFFAHDPGEVVTSVTAGGGTTFALPSSGFGRILDLATGTKSIALHSGQTTVWDQTYTPGSLIGKIATIQKGVPKTGSVVEPVTYRGSKISELDITLDRSGIAKVGVTWVSMDERSADTSPASPALATPSYAVSTPFSYLNASVTLGGVTASTVTQLNVKLTNNLNQRQYMNGAGRTAEPLFSDLRVVDGTITADFIDRTGWSAYLNNTTVPLTVVLTGPQIASTGVNASLTITVPVIKFRGETPKVGSRDVVSLSHPFVGKKSAGAAAITYLYVSGDATP